MISAKPIVGIDVSRDWLDGFCLPEGTRFRLVNSAEGREELISIIRKQPAPVEIGFEATGAGVGFVDNARGCGHRCQTASSNPDQSLCKVERYAREDGHD